MWDAPHASRRPAGNLHVAANEGNLNISYVGIRRDVMRAYEIRTAQMFYCTVDCGAAKYLIVSEDTCRFGCLRVPWYLGKVLCQTREVTILRVHYGICSRSRSLDVRDAGCTLPF